MPAPVNNNGPVRQIASIVTKTTGPVQQPAQTVTNTPLTPAQDGMLGANPIVPGIIDAGDRLRTIPNVQGGPVLHRAIDVNAQGMKTIRFTGPGTNGTGKATFSWTPPTTNTDGTPLTNLGGYKLYYGSQPDKFTNVIDVGNATSLEVTGLPKGELYATVTAYSTAGEESSLSNEVEKLITP